MSPQQIPDWRTCAHFETRRDSQIICTHPYRTAAWTTAGCLLCPYHTPDNRRYAHKDTQCRTTTTHTPPADCPK
jgi:hypothetical protein